VEGGPTVVPEGIPPPSSNLLRRMRRINEIIAAGPTLSVEFFPPRSEEAERQLQDTLADLAGLGPSFASVTYGALGVETAAALSEELVACGAPGLHLYSLNRSTSVRRLWTPVTSAVRG